ncbi:MAG TPA: hypothetical protein VK306_09935 [Acidimicrobiales bacterium]|nr:hypothetical protein [Acidimicrobiales bacterium]
MDFVLGEQTAALRSRSRELIAAHIAEDHPGTDDPADLDVARALVQVRVARLLAYRTVHATRTTP